VRVCKRARARVRVYTHTLTHTYTNIAHDAEVEIWKLTTAYVFRLEWIDVGAAAFHTAVCHMAEGARGTTALLLYCDQCIVHWYYIQYMNIIVFGFQCSSTLITIISVISTRKT